MSSNTYQLSYRNACPDKVQVVIHRDGNYVRQLEVCRARDTNGRREPIIEMMNRAQANGERWAAEDRAVQQLERKFNREQEVE